MIRISKGNLYIARAKSLIIILFLSDDMRDRLMGAVSALHLNVATLL